MRMVEWAFEQDIQHAEKLVLVYLAATASAEGVGMMDRTALMAATSYKLRSIQRLLQRLRANDLLEDIGGPWYRIGNLDACLDDSSAKILVNEIGELPPIHDVQPGEACTRTAQQIDADAIGEAVAKHVIDAAEYHMDQLQNFEARLAEMMKRMALFHVEHATEPPPPPDPVVTNPLYETLLESGLTSERAYALSAADLKMGEDTGRMAEYQLLFDETSDTYSDDQNGRYCRILDILHGIEGPKHDTPAMLASWGKIEAQQNKHTVDGETSAFEQIYPAVVAAAKANVGKMTIAEFLDPHIESRSGFNKPVTHGVYAWEQELDPVDKDDPALMTEIAVMLADLEATNDPRCEVQPQTKETGDDNVERTETVLGYHRRVTAKHREMQRLKAMGVIG